MKYAKYKSGDRDSNSDWFHHCQRNNIPFVTICYRTKLADIEFDYITFSSKSYDQSLINNKDQTRDFVFDLFGRYKNPRSEVSSAGWGVIMLKNIEMEYADSAAEELYDYINSVISEQVA